MRLNASLSGGTAGNRSFFARCHIPRGRGSALESLTQVDTHYPSEYQSLFRMPTLLRDVGMAHAAEESLGEATEG